MVRALAVHSVVDAVSDDVRRRMFTGELAGGVSLPESLVAEEYAVSRSTAKAAIEKLTSEGLLQRTAHKTARVPVLSASDVTDIYRTRLKLESEAVRELAGVRNSPLTATAANEEVRASGQGPALASVDPDMRFHTSLVNALGSPRLERIYASLVDEVRLCMAQVQGRSLLDVELIAGEHQEILDRIGRGDAEGAVATLHTHLYRASERLVAAIDGTSK